MSARLEISSLQMRHYKNWCFWEEDKLFQFLNFWNRAWNGLFSHSGLSDIFGKKYLKNFFREFTTCYFAKKLSFIVTINILKFENHSSKNERFLLALFNFSLSALVLRTSASISFTAPPSGCVNNQKKTRATASIINFYFPLLFRYFIK